MKRVVIVGGGAAGICVAARLINGARRNELHVILIEPSRIHYYQPMWTLVGAGVFRKETSKKFMSAVLPRGVDWIQNKVQEFRPSEDRVVLDNDDVVGYDYLVVCPGIKVDWDGVPGLKESVGKNGVGSNYTYDTVDTTWKGLQDFKGGRAIFTYPKSSVKCAGAPQKIMYLADAYMRKQGIRQDSEIIYVAPSASIFGVEHYRPPLEAIVERKGIKTMFGHHVTSIDGENKTVEITNAEDGSTQTMEYDFVHATPPQCPPDVIKESELANEAGWCEVDKHTCQSDKFPNIFSLGDASSLPTSKTAAAIRKQAPVVAYNLFSEIRGRSKKKSYDGYSSCPLVTEYGKCLIAEFDYNGKPTPTFPLDPREERYVNYLIKAYGLPILYWYFMTKGLI